MHPIIVTSAAWQKMASILQKTRHYAFVFSAVGGGCNGFQYTLQSHPRAELERFLAAAAPGPPPTVYRPKLLQARLYLDPYSEYLLLGTTIDYEAEDLRRNVYGSKFTFSPRRDVASSCGCGVSFAPRSP